MTTVTVTSYSFNPAAGTITFTNLTKVDPRRVAGIYDRSVPSGHQEHGTVLYLAQDAPVAKASGNVLTIPKDRIPPRARSTDDLKITYRIDPPEGWEVLAYANAAALPATGTSQIYYLTQDNDRLYLWDGAAFVAI